MKKLFVFLYFFALTLSQGCGTQSSESEIKAGENSKSYLVLPRPGTRAAEFCQSIFTQTYGEAYPTDPITTCMLKMPSTLKIDQCTVDYKQCFDVVEVAYPVGSNAKDVKAKEIQALTTEIDELVSNLEKVASAKCSPAVSGSYNGKALEYTSTVAPTEPEGCSALTAAIDILKNLRTKLDTQGISESRELLDAAKALGLAAADVALGLSPLGKGKDAYEAIVGRSVLPPFEELETTDRVIAAIGFFSSGSGSIRVLEKIAKESKKLDGIADVVKDAKKVYSQVQSNYPELKKAVELIKDVKSTKEARSDVIKSFGAKSKVVTLKEDQKVYRYYKEGDPEKISNWVTPTKVNDPVQELALPRDGEYKVLELIVPKGTEIIEGPIAPKYGRPGGAYQYFIPHPEVLR